MELILFYCLASLLVLFAILTVTAYNPVRSAVYLIAALLQMAGLFLLMEAEFLAMVQILVYVGGIMVLFLFVIMLVAVREAERGRRAGRQWKTAVVLAMVLSAELLFFVVKGSEIFEAEAVPRAAIQVAETWNTQWVGVYLYTNYLLPFEIASVLLLVAMVGAVILTRKEL